HCASVSGGIHPVSGCHSVIDRPDSVSRVAPPTTTIAKISAATATSQIRTERRCDCVMDPLFAGDGADHIVAPLLSQTPTREIRSASLPIRIRKLIGAVALLVLVTVWALLAMAFAQMPVIKSNGAIETIYYVVAG